MTEYQFKQLLEGIIYLHATVMASCINNSRALSHLRNIEDFVHEQHRKEQTAMQNLDEDLLPVGGDPQ